MAFLIDTSLLIASERGTFDLPSFFEKHPKDTFALASISASELLHGVHRATEKFRPARQAFVERLISQIPVLPFDLVCARLHAQIWAEAAKAETQVGAHDLIIAATSIAGGHTVATRDSRSFPKISSLKFEVL